MGEVQSRHSSWVILPRIISKIPGSKTRSTIWLPPKQADLVAQEKEEKKERWKKKKEKREKKNSDRTTSKSGKGGVFGC